VIKNSWIVGVTVRWRAHRHKRLLPRRPSLIGGAVRERRNVSALAVGWNCRVGRIVHGDRDGVRDIVPR